MRKLMLIFGIIFVSSGNTSNYIKIKDVCEWHHKEIIGWHENHKLFKKRHIEISDKTKYPDTDNKTIERFLLKQKRVLKAIDNAEKKLHSLSKIYHYLECVRFERKFEKD